MTSYSRDDVEFHSDGFREGHPAVNVKVYASIWDATVWENFRRWDDPDEGFTREWVEENISERRLDDLFWMICAEEFDYLKRWAEGSDGDPIFPDDSIEVWQEGRSGGWAVVRGLPNIEEWDAVRLARWRKFARIARSIADDVPYQVLSSLYINDYEWQREEEAERERAANQDIATV